VSKQAVAADFPRRLAELRRLLFEKDERGPGDDPRLQFEAVSCFDRFDEEEKQVVRSLLEGMILKPEARRRQSLSGGRKE
jgi:hypothetical protein